MHAWMHNRLLLNKGKNMFYQKICLYCHLLFLPFMVQSYHVKGLKTFNLWITFTLGDFRNISTISIFLLAVAHYNFYNFKNQNGVNYLLFIVKSIKVTSGFIAKVMKKFLGGATVELFDI